MDVIMSDKCSNSVRGSKNPYLLLLGPWICPQKLKIMLFVHYACQLHLLNLSTSHIAKYPHTIAGHWCACEVWCSMSSSFSVHDRTIIIIYAYTFTDLMIFTM